MSTTFDQPNLFEYATKELAQDAVVAWIFSWLHRDKQIENPAMQEAARSLLAAMLASAEPAVEMGQHLESAYVSRIHTQILSADLCFEIEAPSVRPVLLLIEDKTHTSFHSGQLERAERDGSKAAAKQGADLIKIYFKTGWIRHDEARLPADFTLFRRSDALEALAPHRSSHPVLADFVAWLEHQEREEAEVRKGVWNPTSIAHSFWYHAGLDELLTQMFHADHVEEFTWFQSGMGRGGVPWMHFGIHSVERTKAGHEEDEYILWRADLRSGRPAISLRKYWKHSKSEEDKEYARARFAALVETTERVLQEYAELAGAIRPSRRSAKSSAYFEQEILVYLLDGKDDANDPSTLVRHLPKLSRVIGEALKELDK